MHSAYLRKANDFAGWANKEIIERSFRSQRFEE